jgi:hypothetical protein
MAGKSPIDDFPTETSILEGKPNHKPSPDMMCDHKWVGLKPSPVMTWYRFMACQFHRRPTFTWHLHQHMMKCRWKHQGLGRKRISKARGLPVIHRVFSISLEEVDLISFPSFPWFPSSIIIQSNSKVFSSAEKPKVHRPIHQQWPPNFPIARHRKLPPSLQLPIRWKLHDLDVTISNSLSPCILL